MERPAGELLARFDAFGRGRGVVLAHLLTALLVVGALLHVHREQGPRVTRPLPLEQVRADVGQAFYVPLSRRPSDADGVSSRLEVLEDGRALGPAHAYHDELRRLGGGRYSHWLDGVLFSTSDGTDPRTNGRSYEVRGPIELGAPLLVLIGPLAFLLNRTRWSRLLRAAAQRPAATTACFVGAALLHRGLTFAFDAGETLPWNLVKGVPYSDARTWELLAAQVAEGDLARVADGGWGARRPLYYLFLGAVYAWTGPGVAVAQAVNLLLGALCAGFVFDAVRRLACSPVAAFAALGVALSRCGAQGELLTMSEPLGELWGAVSLWALALAVTPAPAVRARWLVASGLALGLSNLARPLTVLAIATLPLALLLLPRELPRRGRVLAAGAFLLGAALALGPWLAVQRVRHGLSTISDNTAEIVFSATSREHDGLWSPAVSRLGPARPFAARAAFLSEQVKQNLREDLGWYVGSSARALVTGAVVASQPDVGLRAALCFAFLLVARRRPRRRAWWVVLPLVLLAPSWCLWVLGAAFALVQRGPLSLLAVLHGSTWVAMALVRVELDHRFTHAVEASAAALEGWAVWRLLALSTGLTALPAEAGTWGRAGTASRWAAAAAAAFLATGLVLGLTRTPPPILRAHPAPGAWVERALSGSPWDGYRGLAERLVVLEGRVRSDYLVRFEAGERFGAWDAVVGPREHALSVLLLDGAQLAFPGAVPARDAEVVIVGVPTVQGVVPAEQPILEVIALGLPDGRLLRPDPASVAAHVAHITSALVR